MKTAKELASNAADKAKDLADDVSNKVKGGDDAPKA